jgi:hypothetical protein
VVARTPSGSVACGHFAIIAEAFITQGIADIDEDEARTTQSQFLGGLDRAAKVAMES